MRKNIYFIAPFILFISGCSYTIPDPMISSIVLFYNFGLTVGYLLMASIFFPVKNKGTLLMSGLCLIIAIIITLNLMNAYYQNYFEISLPYFWLIK